MKSIGERIRDYLIEEPFTDEFLHEGLLNTSALARQLRPRLESEMGKPVKESAIVMALRRVSPPPVSRNPQRLAEYMKNMGDLIVRSDLSDHTFKNSKSLIQCQTKFLTRIENYSNPFYTFSRGVEESNLVVSKNLNAEVFEVFKGEQLIQSKLELSSITLKLPQTNVNTLGLYFVFFKRLAQAGINVVEVISTTNEFTVIVEPKDIQKAFEIFNQMKHPSL